MVEELGTWLASELRGRGWSMAEMGRRAGYSGQHISEVINGVANPSADFVINVARALEEDPEALLRVSGHLRPKPVVTDTAVTVCELFPTLSQQQQNAIALLVFDLAGTTEHAPTVASRSDPAPERGEIPTIQLDPAAPTLFGDETNPELDQALEMQLEWLWSRFPEEERATLFAQHAIAFVLRMEAREANQT